MRVRCGGCKWSANYGAAKITAEVQAGRHLRRYPHHRVILERYEVVAIMEPNAQPMITGLDPDVPPF